MKLFLPDSQSYLGKRLAATFSDAKHEVYSMVWKAKRIGHAKCNDLLLFHFLERLAAARVETWADRIAIGQPVAGVEKMEGSDKRSPSRCPSRSC